MPGSPLTGAEVEVDLILAHLVHHLGTVHLVALVLGRGLEVLAGQDQVVPADVLGQAVDQVGRVDQADQADQVDQVDQVDQAVGMTGSK